MKQGTIYLIFIAFLIGCGPKDVSSVKKVPAVNEVPLVKEVEEVKETTVKKVASKAPSIIFTVQIGANKRKSKIYESVENVKMSKENGLYKYRLGTFKTYAEAKAFRREKISQFPGAFIQVLKNNQVISIQEAIK